MTTPCTKTEVIDIIREDLREVKSDGKATLSIVHSINARVAALESKARMTGGIAGVVTGAIISLVFKLVKF
jgi:Cdc6-like AAA superfamily ATPase